MPAVTFDPNEFKRIYPQFSAGASCPAHADEQLQFAFDIACLVVDNSERSSIPFDPPAVTARKTILYLLVCHLCELRIRGGGVVGSMTNAAEGSVSAGFTAPTNPNAQWFNQTQCGATAWQLLSGFMLGGRLFNGCFR